MSFNVVRVWITLAISHNSAVAYMVARVYSMQTCITPVYYVTVSLNARVNMHLETSCLTIVAVVITSEAMRSSIYAHILVCRLH
jgi:hypothetical protein